MRPILQDNSGFFTNIAAFWLFLRFETVFRFSDGVFFPSEGKKKPKKKTDHIIPSLFYGSIAKIIGILTEIKRDILPNLNLSKTTMIKIYLKETELKPISVLDIFSA